MPSSNASRTLDVPAASKRTLQRLRRAAGYRSARDFAETLGIPASTYSRYERQPETKETAIPISSAWAIADALGCSIDLVVGREDIDAATAPTIDDRVSQLSRGNRELFDVFLRFLEYRQQADRAQDWR